ncbi:hypothetical protein JNB63_04600 [Microbacterium trichothecenolyticum]|uniref:protealysin inhibitor emfourin n=1 Tax=Microbacterium trichothecenolyticum TaxID=69370 RepID=UPI001C6F2D9D|nr:protealysin inhibitor emfourin [Microbacterium trichothecenolyticum]MBW9119365.1 hypothetical protein [Microbacterium trichothecenolyticum]
MTEKPSPDPTTPPAAPPAVEVDVARTGGIAGITRRWSAQPPEAEASDWITLIDRCPWSEAGTATGDDAGHAPADARGATRRRDPMPDGFVWFIRATWSGADAREAELPDEEVVGAWRELVDAVRDWNRQSSGSARPGR